MTTKITNEQLNTFTVCARAYLNAAPKSKLWFAVDKILKVSIKKLKKVEELKEEKRREFALKKDKGVFDLTPDGKWQFDDAGYKNLISALSAIDETEVEIPTHIIPEGDYDDKIISFDIRNNFEGIVIPKIDYDNFDIDKYQEPVRK